VRTKSEFDFVTTATPDRVFELMTDFSPNRPHRWAASSVKAFEVYHVGEIEAEIREGAKIHEVDVVEEPGALPRCFDLRRTTADGQYASNRELSLFLSAQLSNGCHGMVYSSCLARLVAGTTCCAFG
jgi:hypothetical protein